MRKSDAFAQKMFYVEHKNHRQRKAAKTQKIIEQ